MSTAKSNISSLQNSMSTAQSDISSLQSTVSGHTASITQMRSDIDDTGDVLNGLYPMVALGDITMYQNIKEVLDGLPAS